VKVLVALALAYLTSCASKPSNPEAEEAKLAWKLLRQYGEDARYYHQHSEAVREISR
jgi:hypothetical protein